MKSLAGRATPRTDGLQKLAGIACGAKLLPHPVPGGGLPQGAPTSHVSEPATRSGKKRQEAIWVRRGGTAATVLVRGPGAICGRNGPPQISHL